MLLASVAGCEHSEHSEHSERSADDLASSHPAAPGAAPVEQAPAQATAAARPNILFILDDQHSPRALGVAGNASIQTPRLDQLASEGAYFRQAYCNDPVCGPSRYSMMSGRYPTEIGTYQNGHAPRPDVQFLAQYLTRWGYFTGSSGKTHFTPQDATHGFQELYRHSFYNCDSWSNYTPWYVAEFERRGLPGKALFWLPSEGWSRRMGGRASNLCTINPNPADLTPEHWITRKALSLIDEAQEQGKPFFVQASYFAPHHPYGPLQEFYDLYEDVELSLPASFPDDGEHFEDFTRAEFETIQRHYYGLVSQVDHYIGELLDGLEERGLADNTLVVMVSDHGDMMGEFGDLKKGSPMEGSLGVPFFVRWPARVPAGTRIDAPVSLIDVFPTVFDALGKPLPSEARGKSVLPLIDGSDDGLGREVYALDVRRSPFLLVVAREYRWKLILEGRGKNTPRLRLYDLIEDPWELNNRAHDPRVADVRNRLRTKAEAFWEDQRRHVPDPLPPVVNRGRDLEPLPAK